MVGSFANEGILTLFVEKTRAAGGLNWNITDSEGKTPVDLIRTNSYFFGVLSDLVGKKVCG